MSLMTKIIKYLMFAFNMIVGILIVLIAYWVYEVQEQKLLLIGYVASYPAAIMIAVGIFIIFISFVGFSNGIEENRYFLLLFSGIMSIVVFLEIYIAVYGCLYTNEIEQLVLSILHNTMKMYGKDDDANRSWNSLQTDHKCCGTQNLTEWISIIDGLPFSCCAELPVGSYFCTQDQAFKVGCYPVVVSYLSNTAILISVGQVISSLVAFILARHMKHPEVSLRLFRYYNN